MRFGVLGPLEVRADGEQLAIRGVKERRLLGLLLSRANSVVPVDNIFEALWGTEPPPSAAKSVQVYAVRVRKMLEPNGRPAEGSLVSRRGAGYMLRAARDQVDALRFADLMARAREAGDAGARDIAAQVLREALGLWRGSAYADFQDTLFGAAEAARLEEMRLAAVEARIDADLALGRHTEVIAELESLVREHPLRERLWAQLMIAFYRGGRQSDALLAFRRARGGLVEEIGVEPGPELQALETAVLEHDPGLAAPDPRSLGPPELPAGLRGIGPAFIGRDAALVGLCGFWADAERGRGGVVLVSGPAGSGRTRLAAELAHHAHGRGAAVQVAGAHSGPEGGQASPADLVRSAAGRPVLLVLDDVDQSGPAAVALLEAAAQAAPRLRLLVIATYGPERADARLHAVERAAGRARRLALPPLDATDAALIVERCLGSRAEPGVVRDIVAHGAGLPGRLHELAVAWVEADAAQRVAGAVGQAPAARQALSAVRATAREGLLDLYRARQERAAHAGVGAPEGEGVLCPYKGLARFEKQDAAIFHGREALVATLIARLADTPLVAVAGPSGAGKSSLVRAGLLPALAAGALPGSGKWPQHVLSPGAAPRHDLAPVLASRQALATDMVVVVDQFEELFTACGDEGERAAFVAELLGLLEPGSAPVRVILAVRADYLGWCAQYQELASRVADGAVLVGPMSDDEVRRAVEGPARYAGLEVEPDLLDAVVEDVRGRPGGLPLLSTALLDTWERRRGRALTHAGYLTAGGVSGALARLADSAYARLAPAEQEAARRILVRLADTGDAGRPVRRRVPVAEVAAPGDKAARRALDVLVDRRLLTAGDDTVEVAHEALLSHWPRLARWLEEDEQGRALRRHLAPAAREWAQSGRPDAELYRGARLASALDWAHGHGGDLNAVEGEFLATSRAAADRELREQRERADREARARAQEARAGRRLRVVLAGVVALLLFSVVAGALAVQQRGQARAAQRSAEARRLGARALNEPDLDRSLLLAAAAVRTDPSLETEGDLFTVLQRSPHALSQVRFGGEGLLGVAVSPDGHTLAVSGENGTLMFWDTRAMRRIGNPEQIGGMSGGIAFSPDGRLAAVLTVNTSTSDFKLEVVVWDLARRSILRHLPLPGNSDASGASLTWTRDGRSVAVESGTGRVVFYDVATATQTRSVGVPGAGSGGPVDVYAAGDHILAIAESTRDAILVDPKTAHIVRRITLPVAADSRVAVSRDGHTLAVSGNKGAVFFEDLSTGRVRNGTGEHAGGAANMVLSPNGQTAASLHSGGAVTIWDVRTGQPRLTLAGHSGPVTDGVFTPDGRTLYTVSLDTSVIAWDITGNRSFGVSRPSTAQGPFGAGDLSAPYAGWSANRRRAVIGFQTGLIATIDVATGTLTTRGRPVKGLTDLALSPDGHYAYLSSTGPLIRRWNTTTGRVDKTSTLGDHSAKTVLGVSPDGRRLVACESPSGIAASCYFADAGTLERVGHGINLGFPPGTAAFSPDGRLVALGNAFDQGFSVLKVPNGRVTWARSWLAGVRAIGFSPDGHRLVVASAHGQIATFDAASGRLLAGPVVAQSGPVLTASFAPDGRTILTSGTDGIIRLWEAAHLRPVAEPLHLLPDEGVFAAYTPDGKEVLGLDPTGRVTAWPATVAAWLSRACSIARRDFTRQERTLYSITPADAKPCT
jgi:WD40 repeat protein/DNA-binding SARP family transcriptional activator